MNASWQNQGMDLTDAECVQSACDGKPDQFRFLVERYQRPLLAFLSGRLQSPAEVEETAQESFVRAFLSIKTLRRPESFYAWLLGIARRVLQEEWRAQTRRRQAQEVAETLLADVSGDAPIFSLEEAIAVLPERCRQVILLRYYDGLSCQEIAMRLNMPLGTVTKTLSRAYALLRQELRARKNAPAETNETNNHELR